MPRTTWGGEYPRCEDCGTTEKKYQGRGRCTTCYRHYIKTVTDRRRYVEFKRRKGEQGYEYRCTKCERWLTSDSFLRRPDKPFGYESQCGKCDWQRRKGSELGMRRLRDHQHTERLRKARAYRGKLATPKTVPNELVRPWLEAAVLDMGVKGAGDYVGLAERQVYTIIKSKQETATLKVAERVALALDRMTELHDALPEYGIEGWSRHGRYCLDCGSSVAPHYARGRCRDCYRRHRRSVRLGIEPMLPVWERWCARWSRCQRCGQTDSRHAARGLCNRCNQTVCREADKLGVARSEHLDALGHTKQPPATLRPVTTRPTAHSVTDMPRRAEAGRLDDLRRAA